MEYIRCPYCHEVRISHDGTSRIVCTRCGGKYSLHDALHLSEQFKQAFLLANDYFSNGPDSVVLGDLKGEELVSKVFVEAIQRRPYDNGPKMHYLRFQVRRLENGEHFDRTDDVIRYFKNFRNGLISHSHSDDFAYISNELERSLGYLEDKSTEFEAEFVDALNHMIHSIEAFFSNDGNHPVIYKNVEGFYAILSMGYDIQSIKTPDYRSSLIFARFLHRLSSYKNLIRQLGFAHIKSEYSKFMDVAIESAPDELKQGFRVEYNSALLSWGELDLHYAPNVRIQTLPAVLKEVREETIHTDEETFFSSSPSPGHAIVCTNERLILIKGGMSRSRFYRRLAIPIRYQDIQSYGFSDQSKRVYRFIVITDGKTLQYDTPCNDNFIKLAPDLEQVLESLREEPETAGDQDEECLDLADLDICSEFEDSKESNTIVPYNISKDAAVVMKPNLIHMSDGSFKSNNAAIATMDTRTYVRNIKEGRTKRVLIGLLLAVLFAFLIPSEPAPPGVYLNFPPQPLFPAILIFVVIALAFGIFTWFIPASLPKPVIFSTLFVLVYARVQNMSIDLTLIVIMMHFLMIFLGCVLHYIYNRSFFMRRISSRNTFSRGFVSRMQAPLLTYILIFAIISAVVIMVANQAANVDYRDVSEPIDMKLTDEALEEKKANNSSQAPQYSVVSNREEEEDDGAFYIDFNSKNPTTKKSYKYEQTITSDLPENPSKDDLLALAKVAVNNILKKEEPTAITLLIYDVKNYPSNYPIAKAVWIPESDISIEFIKSSSSSAKTQSSTTSPNTSSTSSSSYSSTSTGSSYYSIADAVFEDLSYPIPGTNSECVRVQYRIWIETEGKASRSAVQALARDLVAQVTSRFPINALSIFVYDGPDMYGSYTVASVDWAPYGDWGRADEVRTGDYSKNSYTIIMR